MAAPRTFARKNMLPPCFNRTFKLNSNVLIHGIISLNQTEQVKELIVLIQVMLSYQVLHKDMIHTFTDVVDRDAEAFLNWRSSN